MSAAVDIALSALRRVAGAGLPAAAPALQGGSFAARAACLLLLPASAACLADSALERLDLRVPGRQQAAPRFMLVAEPVTELRRDVDAPRLAFVANESPVDLPVGALRMRLSEGSSVSLRPRRGGVALSWRKRF
ncbi:MAG: hypothetical protein MZW92_26405 [Comamonadaceae bacterium]|nr:hypothetical protein [Comamonadaceae bacterium]